MIGKKGEDIENLKAELTRRLGVPVAVNIEEVRKPEIDAQLIADSITQQLEKRIMFRRAMKRAMQNAMRLGAQGIKIMSAGPPERHRDRAHRVVPRRPRAAAHAAADIDYGFSEAKTTYGVIGVKVWVYKGDRSPQRRSAGHRHAAGAEDDRRNRAARVRGGPVPGRPPAPAPAPRSRRVGRRARPAARQRRSRPTAADKPAEAAPGADAPKTRRQARPQGAAPAADAKARLTAKESKHAATRTQKIPQGAEGPQHRHRHARRQRCRSATSA